VIEAGDTLSKSRALGALLCIAAVAVIILHIYYGYLEGPRTIELAFALPVTVGLLVVCGLGFWLGWIMATTKEVAPSPEPVKEKESEKSKPEK
jgi:hypothetical protein